MPGLVVSDTVRTRKFGRCTTKVLERSASPPRAKLQGDGEMPTDYRNKQTVIVHERKSVEGTSSSNPDRLTCLIANTEHSVHDNGLVSSCFSDSDDLEDSTSSYDRLSENSTGGLHDLTLVSPHCPLQSDLSGHGLSDESLSSTPGDDQKCDECSLEIMQCDRYKSRGETVISDTLLQNDDVVQGYKDRIKNIIDNNNERSESDACDGQCTRNGGQFEVKTLITNDDICDQDVSKEKDCIVTREVSLELINSDHKAPTSSVSSAVTQTLEKNDKPSAISTDMSVCQAVSVPDGACTSNKVQFSENNGGQRQRSLGPELCEVKQQFVIKSKSSCLLRRSKSYPYMTQRALFKPIRPSPEQSGLFSSLESNAASSEPRAKTNERQYLPMEKESVRDEGFSNRQTSLETSQKRQIKQHHNNPPVARVNPQANSSVAPPVQHSQVYQQPQQVRAHQPQQPLPYCQSMFIANPGYLMADGSSGYQPAFIPVLFVSGPGGSYYVTEDYLSEPVMPNYEGNMNILPASSEIFSPQNPNRASSHIRSAHHKQFDTHKHDYCSRSHLDTSVRSKPVNEPRKPSKRDTYQGSDSRFPQATSSSSARRQNIGQPFVHRSHKVPLLPDPLIPKFSDMLSAAPNSSQSSCTVESQQAYHHHQNYGHSFSSEPSVFHVNPVNCPVFLQQVPFSASSLHSGDVVTPPSQPSIPNMTISPQSTDSTAGNSTDTMDSSSSSTVDFMIDQTGLTIYGPQLPSGESVSSMSYSKSFTNSAKLPSLATTPHQDHSLHIADVVPNVKTPAENVHGQPCSGEIIYIQDSSGSYLTMDAATVQSQVEPVVYQGSTYHGEHKGYLLTNPAIPSSTAESTQEMQALAAAMDNSPATVRMVSSNGPPVPMPMQVPPGHMVQQIVDEHGILTHVILSPQPPGPAGPITVGPYGGPASGSQYYTSYGSPHYGPAPPQFSHRPHHPHSIPPHVHGGMTHIQSSSSSSCANHGPAQSPEYGASPPLNSRDDRTMRTRNRVRKKLQQRRVNLNDNFYPNNTRPPASRRNRVNGDVNMHGESVLIHGQCITPENGPLDVEEESALIVQVLSSMPVPKVTDVEARSSLIQLSPPDYDCNEVDFDPNDIKYELLLSDKGCDAKYKTVFCGDASEITLKDLKPATEYHLKVCAVLTDELKGALTDPVSFQTLQCEPEPPHAPKLMSKTKTSLSLKWNATCENGSPITAYLLEYDQGQGDGRFYEVYSGLQRQFKVLRLNASTRYTFRLAAVNSVGKSPFSDEVSFFTSGSVPSQPDPPMLSEQFVCALTISWIRRPNDDEFLLQMEDDTTGHGFITVYNGPNLSNVVRGLRRNSEYKFRLGAKNEEGQSKWSEVVCYRTQPEKPHPPSKPQIKGKINPYSFRVTWDPPQDTGGSDITKYIVELDNGQGYDTVYEGSQREHLFDHLMPGTVYHIRVACCSTGGRSDFSQSCVATTLPVTPGQCLAPKLQGKPKATSLHLRWSYPDYDGGAQVTQFSAQIISPDNTTREVYKGHDQDCIVAGLSPGRPYLFQVRAFNRAGAGPWSEPLEVVSGAGVPDAPKAPHVVCRSAHTVLVTWEEPLNNGASITEYRLEWQQRTDTSDFSQLYMGPNLSYEAKGLLPAAAYTFRVQAINSAGPGSFSPSASCVTPASSPSPVVTIKVKPNATSALITWREPNSNGSEITSYNITVNEKPPITLDPATEYLLEDLQPETTYKIRIQAMNSIGVGAYSSAVKFLTKALPPSPPRLECVLLAPCSIKLKWGEGRNPDHLTYTLEMEKEDGSFQSVYTGPAHTHKVTRLTELTSYEFRIFASNDAGSGPYSDTYTFTTTKAPPPPLKAPRVLNLTLHGCLLDWQGVKPLGGDSVIYVLQLLNLGSKDTEYRQIYKGPNTQYQLDYLLPNTEYQARVAAVRLSSDSSGDITGAFSPGVTFSPQTVEPQRAASSISSGQEEKTQERRPWSDQQYAAMILGLFVLLAIISAFVCQQLINYFSSPKDPASSASHSSPATRHGD